MTKYYKQDCINPDGKHQIAYTQEGDITNENVLFCVHGLTRNGRDFDDLATLLKSEYRIICPDIVGRGESDWLSNAYYYGLPLYISDMLTLINQLNLTNIDWLGTSMGGLIGMAIAAQPNSPIKRLILNDVGAWIPTEAIERIAEYLCQDSPVFQSLSEVKAYIKKIYAEFGNLTDSQWEKLANSSVKLTAYGNYRLHYDPAISQNFKNGNKSQFKPIDLWEIWSSVKCPVLVLHGEQSNLLSLETIEKMQLIYGSMEVKHFPDCGHVPALMSLEQLQVIKNWLCVTEPILSETPHA